MNRIILFFALCASVLAANASDNPKMLRIDPDCIGLSMHQEGLDSISLALEVGIINDYQWPEEAIVRIELYCGDNLIGRRLANNYMPELSVTNIRFTFPVDTRLFPNLKSSPFTCHVVITSLIGEPYDEYTASMNL